MDLLARADLIILSPSSFSALAAALQRKQMAFSIMPLGGFSARKPVGGFYHGNSSEMDLPGVIRGEETDDGSIHISATASLQPYDYE